MIDLQDLRLDTIDHSLTSLHALAVSDHAPHRRAALSLLARVAPRSLEGPLVAIASDPDADAWSCVYALRALHRMGAALPDDVLRGLLVEAAGALERDTPPPPTGAFDPVDVVLAATTPALVEQVLAWIAGISPRCVPKLLEALLSRSDATPASVRRALVARWADEAPEELDARDLRLALDLAAEPEALDLLERHWRPRALRCDPALAEVLARVPELARRLRDVPALRAFMLAELLGPTGALVDALGAIPFARRLRAAVLRWSLHLRPALYDPDPAIENRYWRAVEHLRRWEHGAVVAAHLLTKTSLAPCIEEALAPLWMRADPPAAVAWLEGHAHRAPQPRLLLTCVMHASQAARPERRRLLQRMLDVPDDGVRAQALRALDLVEHSDDWIATLRAFAATSGMVAYVARTCLAARGDEAEVATLFDVARDEAACALSGRVGALRELSSQPALVRAHRGLFERTLAACALLPANEHCFGVGRLARSLVDAFGDGARPSVLRAYLMTRSDLVAEELRGLIADRGMLRG